MPGQPGHGLGRLLLRLVPGHGLGKLLLLLLVLKTAPTSRHAGVRRRDLPASAPFLLIFRPLRSGARFLLIFRALAILTATPLWRTTCTIPPELPPPPSEPPPPLSLPRSFAAFPMSSLPVPAHHCGPACALLHKGQRRQLQHQHGVALTASGNIQTVGSTRYECERLSESQRKAVPTQE